ncbi:hypothetical protein [Nocardia sp. NPDC057353]|uniref:hypothetical protein n=1 Tax=Nocardia sp. NPDC057353 TaxID=3346104 RepID=UPI003635ECDB
MSPVTGPGAVVADDLLLAAEAAEAEAVAAEARAEAARARARAAQLRREAGKRAAPDTDGAAEPGSDADEPARSVSEASAAAGGPAADEPAAIADDVSTTAGVEAEDDAEADEVSRLGRVRAALAANPRRTALRAAAVLVIAAALATSGFLGVQHREAAAQERRAAEFAAAAKQGVIALTTLDFTHAAADVQRVLDNSTGPFRDDFQGRSADFTSVIEQSQVATEGTVNAVAVESMTADSAVVLVAATSKVTNSGGAQQEPRAWRLSVTVQREGDAVRMSKVEFVP